KRVTSPNQTFVVLTNADLACFGPHETIRASALSRPHPKTSTSSPNLATRPFLLSPSTSKLKHARSLSSRDTIKAILHNHRASRSRSPVKGLFPDNAYESDSERTVRGAESDMDDCSRPKKERKKIRVSKRTAGPRGGSSPSAPLAPARPAVKKNSAAAVSQRMSGGGMKRECEESAEASAPRTTAYPAYITYSKPSLDRSSGKLDAPTPKAPLSPSISQPATATPAVYHVSTCNGD
ncbi:hypothetical protein C0993_012335, partial [Termitomyces sp. T159_Od127]